MLWCMQSLYRSAEARYAALSESLEGATAEGDKLAQVSVSKVTFDEPPTTLCMRLY